ncbi:MAG: carboxylate-amine ligase [Caldilineales bacterium]|nr:carboxylate-amine ligase [Caldilineales bacterium]MDW8316583.1 carboxylate-amine ligase [Anaerolineae bacterium]
MPQPPSLRIGIEEEYQIVHPDTRNLRYIVTRSANQERPVLRSRQGDQPLSDALTASIQALSAPTCANVTEARERLHAQRVAICELAQEMGLLVAASGTHPFASWKQPDVPLPGRYQGMVGDLQVIAERLLIFGMHVHIGVEDRDFAVDCMNTVRYMLPHMLTLSTSSPFWMGRDTGLMSYRCILQENLPRSGIPHQFASYAELRHYIDVLLKTRCIRSEDEIWWDIRLHPVYPSLEFRIFDMCPRLDDAIAIVAVVQATVAWLYDLRRRNISFRLYPRSLIDENKWRAERYGLNGKLIDFGKEQQLPARSLLRELLRLITPYADALGTVGEINHAYHIVEHGTSADRQRQVFREHGGTANPEAALKAVVDSVVAETMICRQ